MTLRRAVLSIVVLATLVMGLACDRRREEPTIRFDGSMADRARQRGIDIMSRPDVTRALDAFFDRVAGDPRVASAGGRLVAALTADPGLATQIDGLTGQMMSDPRIAAVGAEMARAHPDWTADQFGAAFEQRVARNWARIPPDEAGAGLQRMLVRAAAGPDWIAFKAHLATRFGRGIDAYFASAARNRAWGRRLRELNGGTTPAPAQAGDLLLDHMLAPDRAGAFVIAVLDDPATATAVAAAIGRALELDEIRSALVTAAGAALADPALPGRVQTLMSTLLADDATVAQMQADLEALLAAPSTGAAVSGVVGALLADPRVRGIVDDLFGGLADQPSFRGGLDRLMNDW
jgi:hypothetical protein